MAILKRNEIDIAGLSSGSSGTTTTFSGSVVNTDGSNRSGTFNSSKVLAITARILVDPADVGDSGNIYCVIIHQGMYYAMNKDGGYTVASQ